MKTIALYLVTALAEIIGCYLPWLWLKQNGSPWLLVPAAISLAVFAWLLTLHKRPHRAASTPLTAASTSPWPSRGSGRSMASGPQRGMWRGLPWP